MNLINAARKLSNEVSSLRFARPVTHAYNPLDYAWPAHRQYLEKYGSPPRKVVLLGMNPGPWGMVQTGVPFGVVSLVRDWLKIDAPIGKPKREHPKRPVDGFACQRKEVSGLRLWGWARDTFKTPKRFFDRFFVVNYCPLAFLEESGRNHTPDRLPVAERKRLFDACDKSLARTVDHLEAQYVIGVGAFAEKRAQIALAGRDVTIARILHPSPASPAANRGWAQQIDVQLTNIFRSDEPYAAKRA